MLNVIMIAVLSLTIVFLGIWIAIGRKFENKGIVALMDTILIVLCLALLILGIQSRKNFLKSPATAVTEPNVEVTQQGEMESTSMNTVPGETIAAETTAALQ